MNREILFRAKCVDNGEWVYGYYLVAAGMPFISTFGVREPIAVIPEDTVGQFTGLYDKNGNKIFEGDRVLIDNEIGIVEYDKNNAMFVVKIDNVCIDFSTHNSKWFEVIGNVHEEARR